MGAVPIAKRRFANLSFGYNPFREVSLDSLVSIGSQHWIKGSDAVRTFEIKARRPFYSHNHTQCAPYACEGHTRTQSKVVTVDLKGQWGL
ncbi:hypothetical protein SRB5_37730 [Streptomyces sp. RB5]|uniref:Uncharacterized protein n=1 Tax=Streptomyces smaragdinus TaxID=2585196 RepID=A0A7K0CK58_9ACTN|nr:hypothetical protein [Streptomyces smaragdinus]